MVDEDDLLDLEEASRPRRQRAKRGLTVRMLAAKTEWLEGVPVWQEDRVWWHLGDEVVHPEPSDLAQTERTLNRIRRYPRATDLTFGDGEAWLEKRFERLELAKTLANLRCADVRATARLASERDPGAIESLCRLLRAEAHSVNDLPTSPSAALLEARGAAVTPLQKVLIDPGETLEVRALAGMVLGERAVVPVSGEPWLRRARQWGSSQGLPSCPSLISRLLRHPDGYELAFRCDAAVNREGTLADATHLRRWLAAGVPEGTVVEIAEALGGVAEIWGKVRNWRPLLPVAPQKKRYTAAESFAQIAAEVEAKYRQSLLRIADATCCPKALGQAIDTLSWLLPDFTPTQAWADEAMIPIRTVVKLPRDCAIGWLDLLHRHREAIWPEYGAYRGNLEGTHEQAHLEVQRPWCATSLPVFRFLERTGDLALAEEALKMGILLAVASRVGFGGDVPDGVCACPQRGRSRGGLLLRLSLRARPPVPGPR